MVQITKKVVWNNGLQKWDTIDFETHVNNRWGWDIGYEVVVQDSLVAYFLVHGCDFELFFFSPMEVCGSNLGLTKASKGGTSCIGSIQ
jgi:hypothetical protein